MYRTTPIDDRLRWFMLRMALLAVAALMCACPGDSSDAEPDAACSGDECGDDALLLDFTAYIPGAIQVSGLAVSRAEDIVGIVTDFERAILFDIPTNEVVGDFSVQRGDLPEQGSSEAVSFTESGDVAVLYPDHAEIRVFGRDGTPGQVHALPEPAGWVSGMAIDQDTDVAYLIRAGELVGFDLETGTIADTRGLSGPITEASVQGLSLAMDGTPSAIWAVAAPHVVFAIDPGDGSSALVGRAAEVGEASAIEAFVNRGEGEIEEVLAISDDDDQYNDTEGPIRLYLGAE